MEKKKRESIPALMEESELPWAMYNKMKTRAEEEKEHENEADASGEDEADSEDDDQKYGMRLTILRRNFSLKNKISTNPILNS